LIIVLKKKKNRKRRRYGRALYFHPQPPDLIWERKAARGEDGEGE
jgi:hypothetical protein